MSEPQSGMLEEKLEHALTRLEQSRPFVKLRFQSHVLDLCGRMMTQPDGIDKLSQIVVRLEKAGIFTGTDWENPGTLLPGLVRNTLEHGKKQIVILECLSELRFLALVKANYHRPDISAEYARHFLTQVLALNANLLFGNSDETMRIRGGALGDVVKNLFSFILDYLGYEDILVNLIEEIGRILTQRPIQVFHVKAMVTQIAIALNQGNTNIGEAYLGADRLISALFGPTQGCSDDPGLDHYRERLTSMDIQLLQQEAYGFARAMHDVGLVSDYHAFFLRWLLEEKKEQLVADALGLSSTGLDGLRSYQDLVFRLIEEAVHPQTAQAVYGLSLLLEKGLLYVPPIAPNLWRQLGLQLSAQTTAVLSSAFGTALPAHTYLLAGVISVLGQPLGVGQGNNPTCQSARAISMWAYNDPDYLLHIIHQAACYDNILMHFEGQPIASGDLQEGLVLSTPLGTDPVSLLLVPHLDRIYNEMGRLCSERGQDPHRWINPEFHGWWVGREFVIAVDIATGELKEYQTFLNRFYRSYHPLYNGNMPVIHPQPVGVAITDSTARFVGWHAITLLRVALDQQGVMRVYFYNPNDDSGQNWGNGVIVSIHGNGERFGEASLPFEHFASRIYIFHDDPVVEGSDFPSPLDELHKAKEMAWQSWASDRLPPGAIAAPVSLENP